MYCTLIAISKYRFSRDKMAYSLSALSAKIPWKLKTFLNSLRPLQNWRWKNDDRASCDLKGWEEMDNFVRNQDVEWWCEEELPTSRDYRIWHIIELETVWYVQNVDLDPRILWCFFRFWSKNSKQKNVTESLTRPPSCTCRPSRILKYIKFDTPYPTQHFQILHSNNST